METEFDSNLLKGGRGDGIQFAIETDEKVIGQCGLTGFNQYGGVIHACSLSIGIGDVAYWGQGIGREAIALLLKYAFLGPASVLSGP